MIKELLHWFGRHAWKRDGFHGGGFYFWIRYCTVCGQIEVKKLDNTYENIHNTWRHPEEKKRFYEGLVKWESK